MAVQDQNRPRWLAFPRPHLSAHEKVDELASSMARYSYVACVWAQDILTRPPVGLAMMWGLPTAWVSIQGYTDLRVPYVLFAGGVW